MESGGWVFREMEITNPQILSFFKANLHRDDNGIYILNRYKDQTEKGYVDVNGPVVLVVSIEGNRVQTETGEEFSIINSVVHIWNDRIFFLIPRLGAWAMANRSMFLQIASDLEETDDGFLFYPEKNGAIPPVFIPAVSSITWIEPVLKKKLSVDPGFILYKHGIG